MEITVNSFHWYSPIINQTVHYDGKVWHLLECRDVYVSINGDTKLAHYCLRLRLIGGAQ